MNKLYYIVCEEKETTLFEGRYQGRTRGGALKFLKQAIGRKTLNGLIFTITEIPVPLIREIVAEILAGGVTPAANVVPITRPEPEPKVTRFDAFADAAEPEAKPAKPKANSKAAAPEIKVGNPGHGDELWSKARAYWEKCHNLNKTAEKFGLSPNTVKTRARREGWNK
jgi:hypothetical protein